MKYILTAHADGIPDPADGVRYSSTAGEMEICGGEAATTNNRMELTAAIEALSALKEPCRVTLTSDSKYLTDAITKGWVYSWKKKGWKKSDGKAVLNPDLWEKLMSLLALHDVTFVWVKGHAGHPYNERCDAMAQNESGSQGCNLGF